MRKFWKNIITVSLLSTTLLLFGCGGSTEADVSDPTTEVAEATTEVVEELTFDEVFENVAAYFNDQYSSTSNKDVQVDDNGDIISAMAFKDGLQVASNAKSGDSSSLENWNKMVSAFETTSDTCYQYMCKYGYEDKSYYIALLNDKDLDKPLLIVVNGTVAYDIVNEIGTSSTDEDQSNEYKVGDTFECGDLSITFEKQEVGFKPDDPYGFYKLEDGYEYVKCNWTYMNNGSNDAYCSVYDFKCYADDQECEQKYLDADFINTQLSSGRKVSFTTYYAVPKDADSIELEYSTILGEKAPFVIKVK